jgi:hypothetical protein
METTQSQTTNRGAADASLAQGGAPQTCCGGPAPSGTSACCARDAEVRSAGGTGCGCSVACGTARGQEVSVLRVTPELEDLPPGRPHVCLLVTAPPGS